MVTRPSVSKRRNDTPVTVGYIVVLSGESPGLYHLRSDPSRRIRTVVEGTCGYPPVRTSDEDVPRTSLTYPSRPTPTLRVLLKVPLIWRRIELKWRWVGRLWRPGWVVKGWVLTSRTGRCLRTRRWADESGGLPILVGDSPEFDKKVSEISFYLYSNYFLLVVEDFCNYFYFRFFKNFLSNLRKCDS